MRSHRRFLVAALCLFGSAATAADPASVLGADDAGTIAFLSAGRIDVGTDRLQLRSDPVALSGKLALPSGKGPFPLVILAHGCDGIGPTETGWASVLRDWGYATFLMDSFEGRGLDEVCTNAPALRPAQRIPDAYGAIRRLGKHPRIDARRIALMGFSHGGILTVGAATDWARRSFGKAGDPAFRAFFPFYPWCGIEYPERTSISAPIRIHAGALDDWTPPAPCQRLVGALKAAGEDADITLYAGARHSFDYPDLPLMKLADADNAAACTVRLASILGPFAPPVEGPGCVRKGATIEGNREATAQAERTLRQQLAALLK